MWLQLSVCGREKKEWKGERIRMFNTVDVCVSVCVKSSQESLGGGVFKQR